MLFTQSQQAARNTLLLMGKTFYSGLQIMPNLKLRLYPLLIGPTGVGKSQIVKTAANRLGAYAGALRAYRLMLPRQAAVYRTQEPWLANSSPEAVRRAMLEVRRFKEGSLDGFNRRLDEAQKGLQP